MTSHHATTHRRTRLRHVFWTASLSIDLFGLIALGYLMWLERHGGNPSLPGGLFFLLLLASSGLGARALAAIGLCASRPKVRASMRGLLGWIGLAAPGLMLIFIPDPSWLTRMVGLVWWSCSVGLDLWLLSLLRPTERARTK